MSTTEWVVVQIVNSIQDKLISVKNAEITYGQFHQDGDMNTKISGGEVSKVSVGAGLSKKISSCGRPGASTGVEGKLAICDGDIKVCPVYWSNPWSGRSNDLQIMSRNKDCSITLGDWNKQSGAMVVVDVNISKKN